MKINSTDKALLRAVERGKWRPSGISHRERSQYERYARTTLRKYHRLTINLSKRDIEALRERALAANVSCEVLVATVLHKYATGRLRGNVEGGSRRSRRSVPETASKVTAPEKAAVATTELIAPRLLNTRQAAKYLGCSFWTVRDYVLQGLIPVVELPPLRARKGARQRETLRRVVIDRTDLDKFVETRKS